MLDGSSGRRGAGELELRLGDEGAPVAALAAHEAAAPLERAERLAKRHAADAVALGKLSLGRQAVAGGEPAPCDRRLERELDLRVCRPASRLDRSFRKRHYGLDFSVWTGRWRARRRRSRG